MIGKWGKSDEGIHTYSINATTKDDIYTLIDEAKKAGWKFFDTPNITYKAKTFHVLLKLYNPKEWGLPEESS